LRRAGRRAHLKATAEAERLGVDADPARIRSLTRRFIREQDQKRERDAYWF
jgi:hypothetical protein